MGGWIRCGESMLGVGESVIGMGESVMGVDESMLRGWHGAVDAHTYA